jgi:hypothetical protein
MNKNKLLSSVTPDDARRAVGILVANGTPLTAAVVAVTNALTPAQRRAVIAEATGK